MINISYDDDNRAGGNAPMIAKEIAGKFIKSWRQKTGQDIFKLGKGKHDS